jgi:hypothetical protein
MANDERIHPHACGGVPHPLFWEVPSVGFLTDVGVYFMPSVLVLFGKSSHSWGKRLKIV